MMTRIAIRTTALAALPAVLLLAAPLRAEPTSVTVHHVNLDPATAAEARRTFLKIDEAALRVCGASGFSLAEAKAATRASSCWQEAVASVVRRSGNKLLERALALATPAGMAKAG